MHEWFLGDGEHVACHPVDLDEGTPRGWFVGRVHHHVPHRPCPPPGETHPRCGVPHCERHLPTRRVEGDAIADTEVPCGEEVVHGQRRQECRDPPHRCTEPEHGEGGERCGGEIDPGGGAPPQRAGERVGAGRTRIEVFGHAGFSRHILRDLPHRQQGPLTPGGPLRPPVLRPLRLAPVRVARDRHRGDATRQSPPPRLDRRQRAPRGGEK